MRLLAMLLAMVSLAVYTAGCGGVRKGMGNSSGVSTSTPARAASTRTSTSGEGVDDNNIPVFGHEASLADRRAVTTLVRRYFAAAAAADGKRGCELLYSNIAKAVPEDYGKPPSPPDTRGKTCAVVMSKVFRHLTRHPAELAATEVTGVRIRGSSGFAELHNKLTPKGAISIERQGASWRVEWLVAREMTLPPRTGR